MAAVGWLDAAPFLRRVSAGMAAGELLHGEAFSLFEAMSAIEIGDAKMDIGLRRQEGAASAEELIARGAAPVALPPSRLLALLDALLVQEATWQATGAMLPQTIYSCLYMLDTERLVENPVLQAYCVALRSAVTVLVDTIVSSSVCDDEDISAHTFNMSALMDAAGDTAQQAALRALAAAEEQLEQQLNDAGSSSSSCKMTGAGRKSSSGGAAAAHEVAQPSGEQAAALLARMRFRRLLAEALRHFQQYSQEGLQHAARCCELAAEQLGKVQQSAGLGKGEPLGFYPEVNRRHMGLAPPRPVKVLSMEEAVEHYTALLRTMVSTCQALLSVHGSWEELKLMLGSFAAKSHGAVVRAITHMLLSKPLLPTPSSSLGGAVSSGNGALRKKGGKPAEIPSWCPSQAMICRELGLRLGALPNQEAELFVEQCSVAAQGWVHAMCVNRCRQRRRQRHLLEDWKNMGDHGLNADITPEVQEALRQAGWRWEDLAQHHGLEDQGPISTWVEAEACGSGVVHLMLGVPLELYGPHELHALYWYCDYLLGSQMHATRALWLARPPAPTGKGGGRVASGGGRRGSGGGRGGAGRGAPQAGGMAAEEWAMFKLVLLEMERSMCQAVVLAAAALHRLGWLTDPPAPFNTDEQRFRQRFACFERLLRPAPLEYSHYKAACTKVQAQGVEELLGQACQQLARVQQGSGQVLEGPTARVLRPEQVAHLEGMKRIAALNLTALKLVTGVAARSTSSSGAPPFHAIWDFKHTLQHSTSTFYPVLALKRAAG